MIRFQTKGAVNLKLSFVEIFLGEGL
jgi:hypothetical protein